MNTDEINRLAATTARADRVIPPSSRLARLHSLSVIAQLRGYDGLGRVLLQEIEIEKKNYEKENHDVITTTEQPSID